MTTEEEAQAELLKEAKELVGTWRTYVENMPRDENLDGITNFVQNSMSFLFLKMAINCRVLDKIGEKLIMDEEVVREFIEHVSSQSRRDAGMDSGTSGLN